MTMTSQQVISFARNLAQLRPDWDLAGIHKAVADLATHAGTPFALQRQAINRAAILDNRTPTCIAWADQHRTSQPLEQDQPCPRHDGTTRRLDGQYACCWTEGADPEPFIRPGVSTPPEDFPQLVEAAKAAAPARTVSPDAGIGSHNRRPIPPDVLAELTAARQATVTATSATCGDLSSVSTRGCGFGV